MPPLVGTLRPRGHRRVRDSGRNIARHRGSLETQAERATAANPPHGGSGGLQSLPAGTASLGPAKSRERSHSTRVFRAGVSTRSQLRSCVRWVRILALYPSRVGATFSSDNFAGGEAGLGEGPGTGCKPSGGPCLPRLCVGVLRLRLGGSRT